MKTKKLNKKLHWWYRNEKRRKILLLAKSGLNHLLDLKCKCTAAHTPLSLVTVMTPLASAVYQPHWGGFRTGATQGTHSDMFLGTGIPWLLACSTADSLLWVQLRPLTHTCGLASVLSIGASVSALVLPMTIQGWFPLGLICLISLLFQKLHKQ